MRAEPLALGRFDRPRLVAQELREELAERPLADEADAGAVGLVEHRQAGAPRALAHLVLVQLAERHQRARELVAVHGMQEVGLILRRSRAPCAAPCPSAPCTRRA